MKSIVDQQVQTTLLSSSLFSSMQQDRLEDALDFFSAFRKEYKKGEIIFRRESEMKNFGLVLLGNVQVLSEDIMGNRMIMATVGAGETFGESLCLLGVKEIPVYISAVTDCEILWLSLEKFLKETADPELKIRFCSTLAEKALSMNDRIQVLSKKTLREKLYTYFSQMCYKTGKRMFTLPFNREDFALYLGTNRSALSRELSKLQKEGIIEFYRNSFKIIDID